jgi:uncharacterized protein
MSRKFLDSVYQGKNSWQIYLVVLMTIEIYWYYLAGYVVTICQSLLSPLLEINSAANYFIAISIPFVSIFALLFAAVEGLHHRKFCSLIDRQASIDIKRLLFGFGVWGTQSLLCDICFLITSPNTYSYTFEPGKWFVLLPLVLILTPIQTSIEELLYRGYLMQGLSLVIKNRLGIILITSILFAIPHLSNPEMQRGFFWTAMTYFFWGVFFAALTLKDDRLELALGVHSANNIYSFLVVNTTDSAIPTPAIFTIASTIDSRESFLYLLLQSIVFYLIVFGSSSIKSNLLKFF